ncbi:MAG: Hsp70 family protein [Myxococcales bacterium]|nr:Hsp70 family protein [Myxococcales bacterium]
MSQPILGIDLGTINSCVAAVRGGKPVILGDASGRTLPSCVGFKDGKVLVGHAARRQALTDPGKTASAVKRLIGRDLDASIVQRARETSGCPIKQSPLGGVLLEVDGRDMTPVQISARVLCRIRELAEQELGTPVREVVLSVPAHFDDIQRKATKAAAEYAGLEVLRLINEPTAAAFAYGYQQARDLTLAVYDLGGGTFDITVMTARGDRFVVEATEGDPFLGGEDFDRALLDWLEDEFEARFGTRLEDNRAARLRLLEAAEQAKLDLSERTEAEIDLGYLAESADGKPAHFKCTVTREKLETLTRPLIERTLEHCRSCLREAGVAREDLDEVLLVGGQTRTPQVREAVADFFGREPRRDVNPDEVVALGAALYAYSLKAGDLREEAEAEAADAFELALRNTEQVHELLADVRGDPRSSRAGAAPDLPASPDDLPASTEKLRAELSELKHEVRATIEEAERALEEKGDTSLLETAGVLADVLAAAEEASLEVGDHLESAAEHAQARSVELVDVTSRSLGISSLGDVYTILIPRNTPVPAEQTREFSTSKDAQTEVNISVFQGELHKASLNQRLGEFILQGIRPAPRMTPRIEVRFCIDRDGILSVRARNAETGVEQGIRVEDPLGLEARREAP